MLDESRIETMLKSLPLKRPSESLDVRIAAELSEAEAGASPGRSWRLGGVAPLAAAACIGLILGLGGGLGIGLNLAAPTANSPGDGAPVATMQPASDNEPTGAARHFVSDDRPRIEGIEWLPMVEAGELQIGDEPPIRVIRRPMVERRVFYDSQRNATVEVERPNHQIILVQQTPF